MFHHVGQTFYQYPEGHLEGHSLFLDTIVFSAEATFHLSGKVNRHNLIISGSWNPHQVVERVSDSPMVNVSCAVSGTAGIRTILYRRDYSRGSRLPRYAGALPCSTAGCKLVQWGISDDLELCSTDFGRE
jgi:hypothetical protein